MRVFASSTCMNTAGNNTADNTEPTSSTKVYSMGLARRKTAKFAD